MGTSRFLSLVLAVGLAVVAVAVSGCSSTSGSPQSPPPPISAPPTPDPPPGPAYTGPRDVGPCASDADCRALDVCGCSCRPLRVGVQIGPSACEETCRGDGCAGKVARCNVATRQCEIAPGAPAADTAPAPPS